MNNGGSSMGSMSRGGGDRMQGGIGQGQGRPQGYMQQNQRDNYMSEQSINDGSNGRFQMTQYGQMQQMSQVSYMPVHLSTSSQDQQSQQQQHYSQLNSQHRSLQQSLPNHFLDGVEREVDTQYNT